MSFSSNGPETSADWEITPDGLYIATRHYLIRRGYCCANRCRNCPYVNWRTDPAWSHVSAETIRRTRVSPKVLAGVHACLTQHELALASASTEDEQAYHRDMIEHYQRLLERWW